MTIIRSFASTEGGTNNLHIAIVVNDRLQQVRIFTSKGSIERAEKRAIKFMKK